SASPRRCRRPVATGAGTPTRGFLPGPAPSGSEGLRPFGPKPGTESRPVLFSTAPVARRSRKRCQVLPSTGVMFMGGTDDSARETHVSLLGRLRRDPTNQAAWAEFVEHYGGKIYAWCRRWNLQEADAQDVTQNVLLRLAQKMRDFAYDPARS